MRILNAEQFYEFLEFHISKHIDIGTSVLLRKIEQLQFKVNRHSSLHWFLFFLNFTK